MTGKQNSDTLKLVFTVFRHGDRGPLSFLPNDVNKDYWGHQLDTLTNQGKREAYELGLWYRKQYGGFLPGEYNSNDIYVYSTDSDRTIMSAQCVLAAMYPPNGPTEWHEKINWQPIPVHINHNKCEQHDTLFKEFQIETLPVDRCITEYQIKMSHKYLKNKVHPMLEECHRYYYGNAKFTLANVLLAIDAVVIAKRHDLPYNIPPNLDFRKLCLSAAECLHFGAEIVPIGHEIGSNILTAANKYIKYNIERKNSTKMYIYSAHDVHIFTVLGLLNLSHLPRTEYCGFITFELHKLADEKHYVKPCYRTKCDSEVIDIPIENDQTYCSLQRFQNIVDENINRYNQNK